MPDPMMIEFWFIFGLGALCAGLFILLAVLCSEGVEDDNG